MYKLYTLQNQLIDITNEHPSDFTGIIEYDDRTKAWYANDKRHRLDGPAIEYSDGSKQWHVEGKLHRLDGPAVEHSDGTKIWYFKGKQHRLDGPAYEWAGGTKYWYVYSKQVTKEQCNLLYSIMKLKGLI